MIGSPTFLDDLKKTETCPPEVAKVARGLIEPLNEDMLAKNYKAIVGLFKWVSTKVLLVWGFFFVLFSIATRFYHGVLKVVILCHKIYNNIGLVFFFQIQ